MDAMDFEAELERDLQAEQEMEMERHFAGEAERAGSNAAGPSSSARAAGPPRVSGPQRPIGRGQKRPAPAASSAPMMDSDDDMEDEDGPADSDANSSVNGGQPHEDDGASSAYVHRIHQCLTHVPGFDPKIMGNMISAQPPVFETGLPGCWSQYNNEGPFVDTPCRPARVIDMGFIGVWQQASDAERVCDMMAQTDKVARGRAVATCALMGLMSVGMAKGLIASENHAELVMERRSEDKDVDKLRQKLNGKIKTYTYCPNATQEDDETSSETAMMFAFVHLAVHSPAGKYLGFKILMLVFDKGFSLDLLVRKVMEENAEIKNSGQINAMMEKDRTAKMMQQNKMQRALLMDENIDTMADLQYRRICNVSQWVEFIKNVGGQTPGNPGRPYYADIQKDTPPNQVTKKFTKDDEYGGRHPLGPSVSHNMKRHVRPTAGDPGVNVFTAGTLDARGKPLELHEAFADPTLWFDDDGNFKPPKAVLDNGWCHICHDPSVTNIMRAPLPHRMHGNVEPEDCLLEIFWKMHKDTNPILKKRAHLSFAQNREAVLSLFHHMEDSLDPEQQRLSRAVLETEMLSNDCLDKSSAEEAILEARSYDKADTEDFGKVHVISIRQPLRDDAESQERVASMVTDWDMQNRAEIRERDYASQSELHDYDAKAERLKRCERHAIATSAMVKLGLQRFHHTFGRKKARKNIPPGYYDIGHVGLWDAIKNAGTIASRRSAMGRGRIVNPDDPSASVGTANLGFAHKQSLIATDMTPFGHHRAFLMRIFSSGVNIAGRDVGHMLELHMHAFEPMQEVSFFLLLCGGPGSGKSMRAKRLQSLLSKGWIEGSGSASQKAGMNGGFDHLCGRLAYYDGATNPVAMCPAAPHARLPRCAQRFRTTTRRATTSASSEHAFNPTPSKTHPHTRPPLTILQVPQIHHGALHTQTPTRTRRRAQAGRACGPTLYRWSSGC